MADFLTAVSTKKIVSEPTIGKIQDLSIHDTVTVDSAQTALEALKNQPSHETLTNVLTFLGGAEASLVISEPVYASIANEIVSNTIPSFWRVLKTHSRDVQALTSILCNPTGIGHLLTRLRSLIADSQRPKVAGETQNGSDLIEDTLEVLDRALSGDDVCSRVWEEIQRFGKSEIRKKLLWKEYLAQVASGRVLSIRAEAEDLLKVRGIVHTPLRGNDFADWLGRNVLYMSTANDKSNTHVTALAELGSKILSLGYTGELLCYSFMTLANCQIRPPCRRHA